MNIGPFQVTYCTNVHPGESLDAVLVTLGQDVAAVKTLVNPTDRFGTGLRLSNEAVQSLHHNPSAMDRLIHTLNQNDFDVFTVNGFPYGEFSSGTIKDTVYDPDWTVESRVKYTIDLARVLSKLPGSEYRTISTVAGGFKPRTIGQDCHEQMAQNLIKAATGLHTIRDETGVHIRLCLEPEPWTTLETTDEVLEFFDQYLDVSNPVTRDHLGLCYDCCHQAVQFEDASDAITRIHDAGIIIGKVQVSSALHLNSPRVDEARKALLEFAEPRFLHQVVGRSPGGLIRCVDLSELQDTPSMWMSAEAWRCHFHVPIDWRGDTNLRTTRGDWERAVQTIARLGLKPHLEIETYTWHVLPDHLRPKNATELVTAIGREFEALAGVLKEIEDSS